MCPNIFTPSQSGMTAANIVHHVSDRTDDSNKFTTKALLRDWGYSFNSAGLFGLEPFDTLPCLIESLS